jgi:protein SCO1/2
MRQIAIRTMFFALVSVAATAATDATSETTSPRGPPDAQAAPSSVVSKLSVYQVGSTWHDDTGKPITLASLSGRPVVLAMFYTGCENACPIIVSEMKRILGALPSDSRLSPRMILVSFDSDRDLPEVLHLYRDRMRLGSDCVLLHGQPDDVRELAMVLGVRYAKDARGEFSHTNLITILNPAGEIVFQRSGLTGDISNAVNALAIAAK